MIRRVGGPSRKHPHGIPASTPVRGPSRGPLHDDASGAAMRPPRQGEKNACDFFRLLYISAMHAAVATPSRFPWAHQFVCLAPLAATLGIIFVFIGNDEAVTCTFMRIGAERPALTAVMRMLSRWVPYLFYAAYGIMLVRAALTNDKPLLRFALVFFLAQACFAFLLVRVIKISVGLPRPYAALNGAEAAPFSFTNTDQHSFPSGHTSAVALAVVCTASVFRRYALSLLLGLLLALVGFSRIYLTMHHLSDVAAGMGIGLAGNLFIYGICNRTTPYCRPQPAGGREPGGLPPP
jgi:undecaprenyl-diphosphatase